MYFLCEFVWHCCQFFNHNSQKCLSVIDKYVCFMYIFLLRRQYVSVYSIVNDESLTSPKTRHKMNFWRIYERVQYWLCERSILFEHSEKPKTEVKTSNFYLCRSEWLYDHFISKILKNDYNLFGNVLTFQQDGAPPHYNVRMRQFLNRCLRGC